MVVYHLFMLILIIVLVSTQSTEQPVSFEIPLSTKWFKYLVKVSVIISEGSFKYTLYNNQFRHPTHSMSCKIT